VLAGGKGGKGREEEGALREVVPSLLPSVELSEISPRRLSRLSSRAYTLPPPQAGQQGKNPHDAEEGRRRRRRKWRVN